jgi:hypothetical protein
MLVGRGSNTLWLMARTDSPAFVTAPQHHKHLSRTANFGRVAGYGALIAGR